MAGGKGDAEPRAVRIVIYGAVAVFCYATLVHLVQLIGSGFNPYPLAPGWLAAYFVSLTLLDPLAAVLLLQRRRAGLILGCAVLLTDAGANAYANYVLDVRPGITAGRVGQAADHPPRARTVRSGSATVALAARLPVAIDDRVGRLMFPAVRHAPSPVRGSR